jgi:hypothetical protein
VPSPPIEADDKAAAKGFINSTNLHFEFPDRWHGWIKLYEQGRGQYEKAAWTHPAEGVDMKKVDTRLNEKVRRLCRDINNRANDRTQLQTLVIQLQKALGEDRHGTGAVKFASKQDNPFDKIMVG